MRLPRILTGFLGCLTLVSVFYFYYAFVIQWFGLGWPDGYIAKFDRAQRVLFIVYNIESVIAAIGFLFIGWKSSDKKIWKHLLSLAVFQILFLMTIFVIDYALYVNVDHGQGG